MNEYNATSATFVGIDGEEAARDADAMLNVAQDVAAVLQALEVSKSTPRRLALPQDVEHWSLTILREKLVKIGAKFAKHDGYTTFQLAEVAVPRQLFAAIVDRIGRLAIPPPGAAVSRCECHLPM